MKVKIKKYPNFYGIYQVTKWLEHIVPEDTLEKIRGWKRLEPYSTYANWRVGRIEGKRVRVKIESFDTWSLDCTLATIISPSLKRFRDVLHTYPSVAKDDAPEEYKDDDFKRWEWVLDEMIFAFDSKLEDWEEQFYSGEVDRINTPIDAEGNEVAEEVAKYFRIDKGPNHTFELDIEKMKEYQARITNGFRLFGKYYESLWN